MDAEQFEVLSRKLDAIIALLALEKLAEKSKTESIVLLNQFGLDNSTIASIVGTTSDAVSVRVSEAKAKAKKAREAKAGKKEKMMPPTTMETMPSETIQNNGGKVAEDSPQ